MTTKAEDEKRIVVIGGGSTGCSVAYHLASRGRKVLLIEKGQIASGTTSLSTAIVRTHYSNQIVAKMAHYSLGVLRDFDSIGLSGFAKTGMVVLADDSMLEQIEENVSMLQGIGIDERDLESSEARQLFPEINFEGVRKVAYEPDSGYADPTAVASSYSQSASAMGAEILLNDGVEKLLASDSRVRGVQLTSGKQILCSKVVLCTNVWTNKLLARSGVERTLPIRAVPHPVLIYRRPESYQGTKAIVVDGPNKNYYKPEGQSLLSGGSLDSELDENAIEPEDSPQEIPFEYLENFSAKISERIRPMASGTYTRGYYGLYDITPDEHPIIDELTQLGLGGVYSCVGLSGHGFKLCPALGVMVSDMILSEESTANPVFDWRVFALDRFEKGNLLRKKYAGIGTIA